MKHSKPRNVVYAGFEFFAFSELTAKYTKYTNQTFKRVFSYSGGLAILQFLFPCKQKYYSKKKAIKSLEPVLKSIVRKPVVSLNRSIKNAWKLNCVCKEFRSSPQKPLALECKGCPLRLKYQPDFVCYNKIVLELKAVTELTDEHRV